MTNNMTFKELRTSTGMNIKEFSDYFNIPYRTMQNWESERRQCPEYLLDLMQYKLTNENKIVNFMN
jgi:DNA-binding transcriptional regulator YiaG